MIQDIYYDHYLICNERNLLRFLAYSLTVDI